MIIISPTKTMKRKQHTDIITEVMFKDESQHLRDKMVAMSQDKLQSQLKISDNLTKRSFAYYHQPQPKIAAINLYEGAAFKAMNIDEWNEHDFKFINDRLYILSAMYGALRPTDGIQEYRLDYINGLDIDLYDYWEPDLARLVADEPLLLNLASQEFSKSIPHHKMLTIHFLDEKGRNLSTQAKQARGDMLNYIVKHRITDYQDLKTYDRLEYRFDESQSNAENYVFQKQTK